MSLTFYSEKLRLERRILNLEQYLLSKDNANSKDSLNEDFHVPGITYTLLFYLHILYLHPKPIVMITHLIIYVHGTIILFVFS